MSGSLALVVDQTGATLELGTHNTVSLIHADGRRERVGIRALGSVVLHGDVRLSTGVLQALAANGVELTMLPRWNHLPTIAFSRMPDRQVTLRHQQHMTYANATYRMELARRVVWAKLASMSDFAGCHAPEENLSFYKAMRAAADVTNIEELMGVEGAATRKHFDTLESLYKRTSPFCFNGRSRQPPRDEPNALMSLSYTLAQSQATQLVIQTGLDPQIGFLHTLSQDRDSFSLDIIEPARAKLDAWVHTLLKEQGLLKPGMFEQSDESVRLTKEGRTLFYPAWFREGYRIALSPMRKLLATFLAHLRHKSPVF